MELHNVYNNLPTDLSEEVFETLVLGSNIRIERILSSGHATPDNSWYDQEQTEWVMLLQGTAAIQFENEVVPRQLRSGDYLIIPPHRKHRVVHTSKQPVAIWIAVFY